MAAPADISSDNPGVSNWFLLILGSLIWGSAFMAMSVALGDHGPLTIAAGRALIGALVLLGAGLLVGQGLGRVPGRRGWVFVVIIGAVNIAFPFSLLAWGLQHVPSAVGGVAMGAVGIAIIPLAWAFTDESIGPRRILGMIFGFAGVVTLLDPLGALSDATSDLAFAGSLACVMSTAFYAVGSILVRRAPKMPPLALTGGMLGAAAVLLVPVALLAEGMPSVSAGAPSLALLYAGLIPTGFAFFLRTRIIVSAGSLFMSLVAYLVPLWAVIFSIVLLGEDLPPNLYLALALILGGVALAQWRSLAALFGRPPA